MNMLLVKKDNCNDINRVYIITEYVKGQDLQEFISEHKLSEKDILHIPYQLIDVLRYISSHGMVHRDIKLENVMITDDLQVKLIDFDFLDTVKQNNGDFAGTYLYMSPEYLSTKKATYSSDIWALGITLYFLAGYNIYNKPNSEIADSDIGTIYSVDNSRIQKNIKKNIKITNWQI